MPATTLWERESNDIRKSGCRRPGFQISTEGHYVFTQSQWQAFTKQRISSTNHDEIDKQSGFHQAKAFLVCHLAMSSQLISKPKCETTVHGVNKHTHKWVMRRDLRIPSPQNKPHWASSITSTSTPVGLKAGVLGTQRRGYKGAEFFPLLSVCFSSLSLDEEKLGATALVHRVSHLMIFVGDGQLGAPGPKHEGPG